MVWCGGASSQFDLPWQIYSELNYWVARHCLALTRAFYCRYRGCAPIYCLAELLRSSAEGDIYVPLVAHLVAFVYLARAINGLRARDIARQRLAIVSLTT